MGGRDTTRRRVKVKGPDVQGLVQAFEFILSMLGFTER